MAFEMTKEAYGLGEDLFWALADVVGVFGASVIVAITGGGLVLGTARGIKGSIKGANRFLNKE